MYSDDSPAIAADLDQDGRDEILFYGRFEGVRAVTITTQTGGGLGQVNVDSAILRPTALDVTGDGLLEVLTPFYRNDSLWVRVTDREDRDLFSVFLATGLPRIDDDGSLLPWDPRSPSLFVEDVDGDGEGEFVALLSTNLARAPRGLRVYELPGGERVGEVLVGAPPGMVGVLDVDVDGQREIIFRSNAPDNEASLGGLSDATAYVGAFDVSLEPSLRWAEPVGGVRDRVQAWIADLDRDGREEIIAARLSRQAGPGTITIHSPSTGTIESTFTVPMRGVALLAPSSDPDATPMLALLQEDGTVHLHDGQMRLVRSRRLPRGIWRGLHGDGQGGLVVTSQHGTVWLDDRLRIRALDPEITGLVLDTSGSVRPVSAGSGQPLNTLALKGNITTILRPASNLWWWVYRYWSVAAALLTVGLGFAFGSGLWRLQRQNRVLQQQLDTSGNSASNAEAWRLTARRVAHDLRNPLTSILLNVEQLRATAHAAGAGQDADRYAQRINERVERLRRVTRNFLKHLDLEAVALTDLRLGAFTEEETDRLRRDMPPDIQLTVEVEDVMIRADREQLASALDNLVSNALDALPDGGRITVSTYAARGLRLGADPAPRDWGVLEIRDSGTGIAPDLLGRVFDPGVTGSEGGSGYGLAVVRKIVADHDGYIEVESEPGAGTVFSLYLPAADAPAPHSPPEADGPDV
ncbi:MAG: HAMP domain-containing sensor histidine kinase [Bacteroidota bacterium]